MRVKMRAIAAMLAFCSVLNFECSDSGEFPKMIWQSTTLYSDDITNFGGFFEQKIYKDKVVTIGAKGIRFDPYIVAKSLETGKDLWKWHDFLEGAYPSITGYRDIHTYKNLMIIQRVGEIHAIDMNLGETLWKKDIDVEDGGEEGTVGIGKYFFFSWENKGD